MNRRRAGRKPLPRPFRPQLVAFEDRLAPATFTVTNAADAGTGTLRQAILDSNGNGNPGVVDLINFNIGGSGVQTIALQTGLPTMLQPVTIDGYTQPGASENKLAVGSNAVLRIEVNGSAAPNDTTLFKVTGGQTTLRGLIVNGYRRTTTLDGNGVEFFNLGVNTNNVVEGCWLGLNAVGTAAAETQAGNGIVIDGSGSNNNRIGGPDPGQRNVISGNRRGISQSGSNGNTIQGNYIGTNPAGTAAIGNRQEGIFVSGGDNNTITDNVISGNLTSGLEFRDASSLNTVQGNRIGTGADGVTALGNTKQGLLISGTAATTKNLIGGTGAGQGNIIAFNGQNGIAVSNALATGSSFTGNRIFANGALGIDLGNDGVTTNDALDPDLGANNLQNFPLLSSALTTRTIQGTLNSTANREFRLEFFNSASGNGEGETFLGSTTVTTGTTGDATISFSAATTLVAGTVISATATDLTTGDTSEFGPSVTVAPPNLPPLISDLVDQTAPFGGFSSVVPFFVADLDEAAGNLLVSAASDNPALVADKGIVFGGSGTNRTLVVAPNAGQTGTALITVTVTDSLGGTAEDTFAVTVAAPPLPPAPPAGATVQEAGGANAASIQGAVNAFRALLGTDNGVGATMFNGGRREINWDGVPAAKENPFPGDFFNANSPRGVLLSTDGDRLQVSGAVGTPGFEFADVTAQSWGPIEFSSFSSPKIFSAIGSTAVDVEFRLPGTSIPAGVRSFGAIFSDADLAGVSRLEFFDADGTLLLSRDVLPTGVHHEGLSFLGVHLPAGQIAAKVRITAGTNPIDSPFQFPPPDGVALDDFIYSEPVALRPEVVTDIFVVGSGPGTQAQVNVFNADGGFRFALFPYGNFQGGVAVATGDVSGDGFDDIATGAGAGGGPHVKIFDGVTGAELRSFFAYDASFSGGVSVGLGDVTGDLRADIVTGAGARGGPHVKVFESQSLATVHSFFAYAANFRGGITVRAGDVDGDGFADIVTGAGPGGGPHIRSFSGRDLSVLQSFFAGDPNSRGGVFVGVADLRGDAKLEVVGSVGGIIVSRGYIEQDNLIAKNPVVTKQSQPVAAVRFNGLIAILVGAAPGSGSTVNIIDGTSNTLLSAFAAFPPAFHGGAFVG